MKYNSLISKWLIALFIAGTIVSCGENKNSKDTEENMSQGDTITTASGLKYVITKKGDGAKASAGKMVKVHYTGKLTNGKKFDSSRDRDDPFAFELGAGRVIKGWDEGIALLQVGDQATFVIPAELGYGSAGAGADIPPGATLVFDVELLDVIDMPKPVAYDVAGKTVEKTKSGLSYIVVQANPGGTKPVAGNVVQAQITEMLENGTVTFSTITQGQTASFPLGQTGMKGLEEGISLMKTGEKFRLIVPAALAYGPGGNGQTIPPNATIVYDIELLGIK